ncbi:Ctr copper transporter [Paxillus ammoniavirescens]|nr:Ctr copper transporter [Paxillus ammoniavirescens]
MNHGEHEGHIMPARCSMNMLWNTQIVNTCVVFRSWHIHSNAQFVLSFFAIVLLGVLYEYLRVFQRDFDARIGAKLSKGKRSASPVSRSSTPERSEEAALLSGRRVKQNSVAVPTSYRVLRAVLYGASVFLSFFLMLVFMTYNAYLILAVVVGAAIGHYVFGGYVDFDNTGGKGMSCH